MPLILPSQRVIRPNPLAYPAGAKPGIDPAHPASQNVVLSCVASGGPNYINLSTGAPLTAQDASSGIGTASIQGSIGPSVTAGVSGVKALGIPLDPSRVFAKMTVGGIFRYSSTSPTGYNCIIGIDGRAGLFTNSDKVDFYQAVDLFGATLAFNTPYFVACSTRLDGAGSPFCIVVKNLITGQIAITTGTASSVTPTPIHCVNVGNDTSDEWSAFPIAAAMLSDVFLNQQQLLQFAADPWAFWYPRSMQSLFTQANTPVTTTNYAAFSIPQHSLSQLANRMIGY